MVKIQFSSVEVERFFPIEKVIVFENGLEIKRKAIAKFEHHYTPRKGIYEMSKKSLLKLSHIVANSQVKFRSMLLLSWGDFMPPVDGKELKRQLHIFLKRWRHRFIESEYLWFLEFTKQGRPHIHLITTVVPSEKNLLWLGAEWSEITTKGAWLRLEEGLMGDYKISKELTVSVLLDEWEKSKAFHSHPKNWQEFYKEDGGQRYCLKYAKKAEQKLVPGEYGNVGRFWGISENVSPKPIAEMVIGETMDRAGLDRVLENEAVGQLPLYPKYIFQKNSLEYFSQRGLKLTEIFTEKALEKIDNGDLHPVK